MSKGHTDHAKVGSGEYEYPGSSVELLRAHFLLHIRRDVPAVLDALQHVDGSPAAILDWQIRWNLQTPYNDDPWIRDIAQRTLDLWREYPALVKHRQWNIMVGGELVPEPAPIQWEPTQETQAAFLHRVKHVYVPEVQRWAASLGLVETLQKPNLSRDMGALVRYQVKRHPLDVVTEAYFGHNASEDTARKAITNLANLIVLALRK
jgi:hypothetical protein